MKALLIAALSLLTPAAAFAAPSLVDIDAFSGDETVLDLDLPAWSFVTTQYVADGVEVEPNGWLIVFTNAGALAPFTNSDPGAGVGCNFSTVFGWPPMTIDFTDTVDRVGFDVVVAAGLTIELFTYDGTQYVSSGTLAAPASGANDAFVAVEDLDGIDRITVTTPAFGGFCINDLRLEED